MSWGSGFGFGKKDFMGGLVRTIATQKKKNIKKIAGQAGGKAGKKYKKWGKTNEGKLIKGVVGGYMKHRTQINKGLKSINFAD